MRRHSTRLSQAHDEPDEGDDGLTRTADRDYPELGTILDDRPDPGSVITVIGSRRLANAYGTETDDRDGQFNGEPGDTGVYWSEPGQQQWTQEHEPQEPAPPPPWAMSPVMARLAELEAAAELIGSRHHATGIGAAASHQEYRALKGHLVQDHGREIFARANHRDPAWQFNMAHVHDQLHEDGQADHDHEGDLDPYWEHGNDATGQYFASRHHATDINGTHVDDHGDAPQHGSVPRAGNPDSYDARSTEGDGDPKWDDPLDPAHKEEYNGATVGMYPEGISAGGGPGISVGPVTARVPWTPKERGELHTWQENPPGATWGDFVPSSQFPFLRPGESQHGPGEEDLRAEGAWEPYEDRAYDPGGEDEHEGPPSLEGAAGYNPRDWTDVADRTDHSEDVGGWVHHTLSSRREAASDAEDRYWRSHLSEQHGWSAGQFERARMRGENLSDLHAAGHSAGLADHPPHAISSEQRIRAQRDLEREDSISKMFGPDISSAPGKDRPEGYGLAHPARGGYAGGDPAGAVERSRPMRPPRDAGEWEERDPARFRRWMSSLTVHAHDDPDDSLDSDADRTGPDITLPQASEWGGEDSTLDDGPDPGDGSGIDEHPEQWPAAGAAVSETSRAMTQGRYDGKTQRAGHLAAFVAAAGSSAFRFEFTAAWQDVLAKAKRIRAEGHVRITHASAGMVIGEVRGDHDTYESGLQRPVGRRQSIQHWACGCPWASFHQDKSAGTRYAGRPCSHVMALQFEAQSRGMFGRQVGPDESLPQWSPPTVVVKSMPPWEGEPHAGRWREEWRAPVASRTARWLTIDDARQAARSAWHADGSPEPYQEWLASSIRSAGAALDQGGEPLGRVEPERTGTASAAPCQRATAFLLRSGADPAEVGALRLLAGLGPFSADGANGPWGSDNTVSHPPQKPYGATSPPDRDMDPGSYGPLAGPDPENWGRIDSGDVFQMPIGNTAAVRPAPGDLHWPDQSQDEQGTFSYQDRANAAGPSTAMTPRDPNGIRMEESSSAADYGSYRYVAPSLADIHQMYEEAEDEGEDGNEGLSETQVPDENEPDWGSASRYRPHEGPIDPVFGSRAELHDEPEAALPSATGDDEIEATAAADGTIGGGDAGDGVTQEAPLDTAALGEFGASAREEFRRKFGGPTAMGDQSVAEGLSGGAQEPSMTGQQPGMGSMDEPLMPDDQSIQTIGTQQWSGGGADSDEGAVEPGQPQGGIDDIVASFQRSAAARAYTGGGGSGGASAAGPGDIAGAARAYLAKTAEVLPQAEADELIREGRGQRARNLDLLNLEGTHYEDEDGAPKTGVSMDDYEDDVIFA
jgi:hypothetical protein